MELTTTEQSGVLIARVQGDIDMSNVRDLAHALSTRVSNRSLGVILDLAGVGYLDSSGLELLFDLNRRLTSRRQKLRLVVPPSSPVRHTIEVVGLDRDVGIDTSIEAAQDTL